jgi:hypothetical protein
MGGHETLRSIEIIGTEEAVAWGSLGTVFPYLIFKV